MDFRSETDLLGTKDIPNEQYWGIHTKRAMENFQISGRPIEEIPELIIAFSEVKEACAMANLDLGILDDSRAEAIIQACRRLRSDKSLWGQFPIDQFQGGAGTSVNMNVNEVIANLGLESMGHSKGQYSFLHPNDDVNRSQSTNDSYPTSLRIAANRAVDDVIAALAKLRQEFAKLARKYWNDPKMGRTQLQDAVPMRVGQEFGAIAQTLHEEELHLKREADLLLEVNLGATAIGTGVNAAQGFRERALSHLKEITGLALKESDNLIEATSDTGAYVAVHASLKRTAVKLSKIASDLRLLSSGPRAGVGEISLPRVQAGSSIMPAKVNPVIPEVVNQVCFKVVGNDMAVTMAAEAGQLQLNVMEPMIAECTFESIRLLTNAIDTLRAKCVSGITVNVDVAKEYVFNSIGLVTYLNDLIGHDMGDEVGRECAASGRSVREVVLEKGLLDEATLDEALSIENLLSPKYLGGSRKS